ncbi:MAG: YtxH domain-containing protein [Bryobacteraceae bacterium]
MASNNNSNSAVWFLTGAALGAAVALLYAPQSGEETRKLIGKKSKESAGALNETGRDMIDKGKEMFERGRQMADDAADMFERGRKLVEG